MFVIFTTMSFVKFRAIAQPFNKTFTRRKLIRSLKGFWIFVCCAVFAVSIEFWIKTGDKCYVIVTSRSSYVYYAVTMILAISSLFSVVYFFTRIIIALKRHQRQMASSQNDKKSRETDPRLEKKAVVVVAIIVLMFFVFWMPTGIVRLIRSIGKLKRNDVMNSVYMFSGVMIFFTSLVHAIVLLVTNSELRENVLKCISNRSFQGPHNSVIEMTAINSENTSSNKTYH